MSLFVLQEDYVEYSRHGSVIKGQEKAKVKSRYEEDVYLNNHSVSTIFINHILKVLTLKCDNVSVYSVLEIAVHPLARDG